MKGQILDERLLERTTGPLIEGEVPPGRFIAVSETALVEGDSYLPKPILKYAKKMSYAFKVETPEGVMRGYAGDYLVRDVEGGLYPCRAEIFEKTYIKVKDEIFEKEMEA